jgi:hypothetical protein
MLAPCSLAELARGGELPHIFDGFWRGQGAAQTSGSASASRSPPNWPGHTAAS